MKLLIIGASGMLGARLYNDAIKKRWNVLGTYCLHEYEGLFHLDLRDRKAIVKIFNFFKPDTVALIGCITDVDLCELKPRLAEEVNIKGAISVIRKAKECAARVIYLSSDYIFNGEKGPYGEDDAPSPINIYGKTKLEAERAVSGLLKNYLIVRTSQLYGPDYRRRNFAVKIICNMRSNKKIYAADDFYSTPTYVASLSKSIIELIEKRYRGIFNIAGRDCLDRYSYVSRIADVFNLEKSLIKRVSLKDLHLRARRPQRGGLKINKAKEALDSAIISVDKGLDLFKKELNGLAIKGDKNETF
jgi:dTDP-4-dehydrorhamnose reductase